MAEMARLEMVESVEEMPSFWRIFGKRIIVVGEAPRLDR